MQDLSPANDWELRQKHAAFFQTSIGGLQQEARAACTFSAVLLTLGVAMAKFSGMTPYQDWLVLLATVMAWLLCAGLLVASFSRPAVRLEARYLREHADLFPGALPYPLPYPLLDFATRCAFLTGKRSAFPEEAPSHVPALASSRSGERIAEQGVHG